MICLVVMTDGRGQYIQLAIPSLELLGGDISRRIIHDDSGDPDYRRWLASTFPGWEITATGERQGFAGAYHAVRKWLHAATDEPFIFSTEDDFILQHPIDLAPFAYILNGNPYLTQLAVKRQPCNPAEEAAGGFMELRPDAYLDRDAGFCRWTEHRLFWTTNPHLTHRDTLAVDWPEVPESEGMFTHQLLRDGLGDVDGEDIRFGYIGHRQDPPLALHIGVKRAGTGY